MRDYSTRCTWYGLNSPAKGGSTMEYLLIKHGTLVSEVREALGADFLTLGQPPHDKLSDDEQVLGARNLAVHYNDPIHVDNFKERVHEYNKKIHE